MARKSRKNPEITSVSSSALQAQYRTAIYVRLSVENSGKCDDGESIANQTGICREYLQAHTDLTLYGVYEDNGRKGTNFDRPEFNRLMDDVRSGKVNCILVKDLSRFGRDYIEAGEYLEKIFPFLGVRFISITDGYDSLTAADAEGALMVPLKNMINDIYAKDISRKIITSFRARQEKGEFLPGLPPYGYVKSKTTAYRYEIDTETAGYVRMMFEWKAENVSTSQICQRLTEMDAVTPARRKFELGIRHSEKNSHSSWSNRSVTDILTNPVYTGCLVYGRMPKSLYQGVKMHRAEPSEWRILPDMHEPIVSRELFDRVQEVFAEHKAEKAQRMERNAEVCEGIIDLFKGRIFCADCGKRMRFIKNRAKPDEKAMYHVNYVCAGYIDSRRQRCSLHTVKYDEVKSAVSAVVKEQALYALELEELVRQMRKSGRDRNLMDLYAERCSRLSQERDRVNSRREKLFENYAAGILDDAEYQYAKRQYDGQAAVIEEQLASAMVRKADLERVLSGSNEWLQAMKHAEGVDILDAGLVENLVSRIMVYEGRRVEVELNYTEQRSTCEGILAELQKENGDE